MSPALVHADLRSWLSHRRGSNRLEALRSFLTDLRRVGGPDLWMPTFNYEFCRGSTYDVRNTPSQTGVLSEYFRTKVSTWRTPVPVFSVSGVGTQPFLHNSPWGVTSIIEPFGPTGVFAELVRQHGMVLMAGCDIRFLTLTHYAEVHQGRAPLYRYDKDFPGIVRLQDGLELNAVVRYHVTPLHDRVTYNWNSVRDHMLAAGVLRSLPYWNEGWLLDASGFVKAWQERTSDDSLWALSSHSRLWVEPMLEKIGRRFRQSDFESPEGGV